MVPYLRESRASVTGTAPVCCSSTVIDCAIEAVGGIDLGIADDRT